MGLRTASVRHPNAVVMAPALTEASQPQSFKLTSSRSASPINNTDEDKVYFPREEACLKAEDDLGTRTLKGKEFGNVFDNLNTLALASELLKSENSLGTINRASDNIQDPSLTSTIMNNCSIPMGDQTGKMGLQKTGLDTVSTLLKDKSATSDVDQLFNHLSSDLPVSDMGISGDNVDDIMQVIKSMEGSSERSVTSDLGGETDPIFPLTTGDLTGNFSSLEKELFNDDMMNISIEEQLIDGATSLKETQIKDASVDVQKQQVKLERKVDFFLRKLRKMQIRQMGHQVSSEVAGTFEHVHRLLRRLKENPIGIESQMQDPEKSNSSISEQTNESTNMRIPPEKIKPISQSSTRNLVRKLEMSTILQANTRSRQRHTTKYFGSGSIEPNVFRSGISSTTTLPVWPLEDKQELQKVSGLLHSELSLVQQEVDSEATASSSGGESCDEMQTYNNSAQQYLSIQKRAGWKYATERAAIASRWTWLQAQISDLEYRIRQHSDLHRQIRINKGCVNLGGSSPPASVPSSPTTVNGYRGQLPGASPIVSRTETPANGALSSCADYQCARTRPLCGFRKRKLLQTTGLHAVSKKAARPSTIRCGCVPPAVPCALCTGRTDPTHPRDLPEHLSKAERIALLDPGFHPVFSLAEDVSAGIHLEAIMKTPEWQQRRSSLKSLKCFAKAERLDKNNLGLDRPKKLDHRKRKYNRLLKPTTVNALSAKIKSKIRGRKGRHSNLARLNKKRHTARVAMAQLQALTSESVDEEIESYGSIASGSMKYDSPSSSPLLSTQSLSGYHRRNRTNSYDIDNIVIPYSVAASTRVEKLQYKEILTPKWRIAEPDFINYDVKNNGIVKNPSQDSDVEDLTEEAVVVRHDKCEHDEKKKFLSYLKLPVGYGRTRSHKRTDSRAESSGANTPDPMSPHAGEILENIASPLTSPPATPLSSNNEETSAQSISALRRRTISQSRWAKDKDVSKDDTRCNTPESVEVPPFDRRVFPLTEEVYDKMLKNMPENHKCKAANILAQDSLDFNSTASDNEYKIEFHDSESTESAYGDEDPNDPEWIAMERVRDRYKR